MPGTDRVPALRAWLADAGIPPPVLALFALYLWVLPLAHTASIRTLLLVLFVVLTGWHAWKRGLRINVPLLWPWLLFTLAAFVSLTYAVDVWYSLGEIKSEIGYGVIGMILAATWVRSWRALATMAWVVVAGDTALVSGTFYNFWRAGLPSEITQFGAFNLGVGNTSTYLLIMIPFVAAAFVLAGRRRMALRFALAGLLAGNLFALYLTANRMGLIVLGVEIALFAGALLWRRRNAVHWAIYAGVILVLAASVLLAHKQLERRIGNQVGVVESMRTDVRWDLWRFSVESIRARPYTGGGFGRYAFKLLHPGYPRTSGCDQCWHPHNGLLSMTMQIGLPGLGAFLLLLATGAHRLWRGMRAAAPDGAPWVLLLAGIVMFVGLLLKIQTDDFFHRDIGWFFWTMMGALVGAQSSAVKGAEPDA